MKRLTLMLIAALSLSAPVNAPSQVLAHSVSRQIPNPEPASQIGYFGSSIASLGPDRFAVASAGVDSLNGGRGAVYLYHTNGSQILAITNPAATGGDFGRAIVALGADRLLVGGPGIHLGGEDDGAAYLYSTNGSLLTIFTNPTPSLVSLPKQFGSQIAILTDNEIAISAPRHGNFLDSNVGEVYVFNTNGALIHTISNSAPNPGFDGFGQALCSVGEQFLLVGAPGVQSAQGQTIGAAYLCSKEGVRIVTITNPQPELVRFFGSVVTALGSDRVLISSSGVSGEGLVYLYGTNGTLLTTFTGLDPSPRENLGRSLTVVDANLIAIGAPQDTPFPIISPVGSVGFYNTNGTLIHLLINPSAPFGSSDLFGYTLVALHSNVLAVGSPQKTSGQYVAGSVTVFDLSQQALPTLSIAQSTNGHVRISWPYPSTGFLLESGFIPPPAEGTSLWSAMSPPYTRTGYLSNGIPYSEYSLTLPAETNRYFRLRQP